MKKPAQADAEIVVEIYREYDGQIVSRIRTNPADINGHYSEQVVIDRAYSPRQMSPRTIKRRAESLALMLKIPLIEDYTWHCQGHKKLFCRCPKCIEDGIA